MSKLIVEVCRVETVEDHPNPVVTRMKVATVKGWQTCIGFNPDTGVAQFKPGDKCIYFPPDSVLPPQLAHGPADNPPGRLDVMRFLGQLPKDQDTGIRPPGGRVRAARLQGFPSYGLIMRIDQALGDNPDWEIGTDVAEHFGVTKWEPPIKAHAGDAEPDHVRFHRYTEIENYGNFPGAICDGTEVVFTEKLHGQNSRAGLVLDADENGSPVWLWMAGSHDVRRKEFDAKGQRSAFWDLMTDNVKAFLMHVRDNFPWAEAKHSVILFAELIGTQDMKYGLKGGVRGFRAFDLAINGRYIDFHTKVELFRQFGIEPVPILYRGPFSAAVLEEHTNGPTTVCPTEEAGKFKGREGIVITPVVEQFCSLLSGRLILKSVSADYHARKGGTDAH